MKVSTSKTEKIIRSVIEGDKTAIAEALNILENKRTDYQTFIASLIEGLSRHVKYDRHIVGITGPPGVGKSSLISDLLKVLRERGKTVGLIAIDPTSKKNGGALLGDRSRIRYDPLDDGIFIRSMAAGDHLGGLARRTCYCMTVFEVAYDYIIIETVGVGQSETEIDHVADTIIFVVQPGSGDVLQFMKSGIIEIPHLLVINKADQRSLATKTRIDLEEALGNGVCEDDDWRYRIIETSAYEHWGAKDVVDSIEKHYRYLIEGEHFKSTRRRHQNEWIYMMFKENFGIFGLEYLGGSAKVREKIRHMNTLNFFQGYQRLKSEFFEKINGQSSFS